MPNDKYFEAPSYRQDTEQTTEKNLQRVATAIDTALRAGVDIAEIQQVVEAARRHEDGARGSVEYSDV